MRISKLDYNSYYPNNYKKNRVTPLNRNLTIVNDNNINFEGKLNKNSLIDFFNIDPIYKFKNFTKDEYLKLSEIQKNQLRKEFKQIEVKEPEKLTSIGETHAFVSDCIKKTFDKRFGQNNYIVVIIGRSLSSIGKSLGIKIGENNVINIPMSSANRFCKNPTSVREYLNFINSIRGDKGLKDFKKYLKLHNLSKSNIESSGKNYILMDYCYQGHSLTGAEQFFKSDEIWGNKKNNIFAVDFIRLLNQFDGKTIEPKIKMPPEDGNIIRKIQSDLCASAYKNYSTVEKSTQLKNTISASEENKNILITPKKKKLVWFNLIDTIMTGKGNFQVKLNQHSIKNEPFYQAVQNQKVEPWHNGQSQYCSDLTNTLNEINKILIKFYSYKNDKIKKLNEPLINNIKEIRKYLCNCYKHSSIISLHDRYNFYKIQSDLMELIEQVNSNLSVL